MGSLREKGTSKSTPVSTVCFHAYRMLRYHVHSPVGRERSLNLIFKHTHREVSIFSS